MNGLPKMLHVFKAALPPDAGVTQIKSSLPCLTPMLICAFCFTSSAAWNTLTALFPHLMNSHSLSQHNSWSAPPPNRLGQCAFTVRPSVSALAVTWSWFMLITPDLLCVYFIAQLAEWGPAPSTRTPAGSHGGGGTGGGTWMMFYSAVTLVCLTSPNRGCVCQSWVTVKHFLLCWQTHWFLHRGCLFW